MSGRLSLLEFEIHRPRLDNGRLAALSLVRDPLADIGRATPEFDAFGFGLNQKLHSVTADQLYLRKFDRDDSASVERDANEFQIFRSSRPLMTGPDPVQSKVGRFGTSLARIRLSSLISRANGTPFESD